MKRGVRRETNVSRIIVVGISIFRDSEKTYRESLRRRYQDKLGPEKIIQCRRVR